MRIDHLADGQPAEMGSNTAAGSMKIPAMPEAAAPEDQGGEEIGGGAISTTLPETKQAKVDVVEEEAAVLARGNALFTELGIPPSADIAALSREVHDLRTRYEEALRKLAGVQKKLVALRQLRQPKANVVQMRVKDVVRLHGPISTAQIIKKLAGGGFTENSVRNALGSLNWHQHVISSREGWELIDDEEVFREWHWRSPRQ